MKRLLFLTLLVCTISFSFAQEGTKQFMPSSQDRLWLEFGVFVNNNFGLYNCDETERINIYLNAGEKVHFGMKLNTENYGGDVGTEMTGDGIVFRVRKPNGVDIAFSERKIPTSGTGYIASYEQATKGPNGVSLNGTAITGGYTPYTFTADVAGHYIIEYKVNDNGLRYRRNYAWYYSKRFALQYFDVTVTDGANNIVTNPGEPNKSAGRLWSKGWSLTNTSFTQYPVNAHFYVVTTDKFINKVNFKMYPYSFTFVANHYGVTTLTDQAHYIKRTQSKEGDQTVGGIQEFEVFLNDPDRVKWNNEVLPPPTLQVWAEEELFLDYNYNRDELYLPIDYSNVILEKNRPSCAYDNVTFFKIESNIDGYTAILIDINGDGEYTSGGTDRVIYSELKVGLNYILWDFKNDNGALVGNKAYTASATFLGRGPSHFPLYDVERIDGITTTAIRPFNKLQTTIYWDDTQINDWGDGGSGNMAATKKRQLVFGSKVPRIWSWGGSQTTPNNGNLNTMNTWFNAIDLGYSKIGVEVKESTTKCVDGSAPYVGDVFFRGPKNTVLPLNIETFDYKFFHPKDSLLIGSVLTKSILSAIRIVDLPAVGTLKYNETAVTVGQEISRGNVEKLKYTPPSPTYYGKTSFKWKGCDPTGKWSNNQENVYLIINTPPTISTIPNQKLCTNTYREIDFEVDDAETPANDLVVTGFSSKPEFVPNSGVVISGTGKNRKVTVTPVANKSGEAIIYIMVDDGLTQAITQFAVTVSPSLEFSGRIILCTGEALSLTADEPSADSYSWKYNGAERSPNRVLNQAPGVGLGDWTLTIVKTVEGNTCTSSRDFTVEVSPLTTFEGDFNVCVGEEISLTATEVNATKYTWRKGSTIVSEQRNFKKTATLGDAASNYTLFVDKDGCQNTSPNFDITVKNQPNTGLTALGNTVDPGKNGTITINSTESGVAYDVYKGGVYVTSANGPGSISITIPASNLEIGANEFTIQANNGNCSVELLQPVTITVNEPGIVVSPLTLTTSEGGSNATFTVVLKTQPSSDVVIPISSNNTAEGTVSPSSITFSSANWATPRTVTVTPVKDFVIDGNKIYSIVLSAATGTDLYYSGIDADDVTVTNMDTDIAGVTVTGTSLITTEAGGTDQFTLVLTSKPTESVTINFSGVVTTEGTLSDNVIVFTPDNWDSPQTVTVSGVDDDIDDGDVYYTINMSSTSGDSNFNGLTIASVNVVNHNNDTAEILVSKTTITTTEAGGTATFSVSLKTQPTTATTISITSSNINEGTVNPSTLTFTTSNWATPQTVTVTGQDDDIVDGNADYTVTVKGATGDPKYIALSKVVNAVNTDNDVAEIWTSKTTLSTSETGTTDKFNVRLTAKPAATITIAVTSSNTGEATVAPTPLTFTTANWNTNQEVTVTGVDDYVIDGSINYTITLAVNGSAGVFTGKTKTLNGVNADNDVAAIDLTTTSITTSEAGTSESFGVKLTAKPASDVKLNITGLVTAEGSINKTSLTFTSSNWNVYQDVTVTGVDDAVQDGNQVYTLTIKYASGDTKFAAVTAAVQVTNIDNDKAGITVDPKTLTILEGNSSTFSISLSSKPTANVTINITSPNTSELTVSPATVIFTPTDWASKTVTVNAIDDKIDDGDKTYTITTSNAVSTDGNYSAMVVDDVTVNITDIHTAGITVSAASGNTTEAGGTATFSVVLNTKPTANVTITSTSLKLTEGTISANGTLTFTPSNWSTPQLVTVKGVNDNIDDGDQPYQVSVKVSGSDTKYTSTLNTTVDFINVDDDTAGVTVTPTSGLQTTEAGGTATFTVVLNSQPTSSVTINFLSSNTAEGTVSPASVIFTTANWNTARTITLTGVNDDVADGDQPYNISSTAGSTDTKYNNIAIPTVNAINKDNDIAGVTVSPTTGLVTTEAGGTATFTVKLNSEPKSPVTITSTSSRPLEGVVSINKEIIFNSTNWKTAQTVTIKGVDDDVADGDQSYTINLSALSIDNGYNNITIAKVNVTNTDNDVVGLILSATSIETSEPDLSTTFTVNLKSKPIANVTVAITSSNESEGKIAPASATLTFTAANWSTPQTVTVLGQDDYIVDGDVPYNVILNTSTSVDAKYAALANVTVSAVNKDNDIAGVKVSPYAGLSTTEKGGTAEFTVVLTSRPTANISIKMSSNKIAEGVISAVSRGTVAANLATITFTPDQWNSPVTVTVTGVDDDYDDGDIAYEIIIDKPTTTDVIYKAIKPRDVSLSNIDDDTFGVLVLPTSLTVNEDGASKTFTIVLNSRPQKDVTIPIKSSNAARLTVLPASLTFTTASATEWKTPKVVTVTPINNKIDEGSQEITIETDRIVSTDVNYGSYNPSDVIVQFIEDDKVGVTVSPISGTTNEDGRTATFTIVLNSEPTANVVIGISSSNTAEGIVSISSVTFTKTNWNTPVTVTVTGVDDVMVDGTQSYQIVFANAVSTDLNYNEMVIPSIEVLNEDNDSAGVSVFPISGLITTEAEGTATFDVKLITKPTGNVVINVVSSNTSAGTVLPATLTFTSTNWNTVQKVTVKGVDNLTPDGDKVYQVNLAINKTTTIDADYKLVTIQSVSVTNKDDLTPRPKNDTGTTDQENAVTINVLSNDLGLDYGPVTVSIVSDPAQGTVKVNANNSITYTPNRYYHGNFTFTYSVCNSLGNCAQANVTITVTRNNVTPIAVADFRGTSKNTPVDVDVLFNDKNLYDAPIKVTVIGTATPSGTLVVTAANKVTYKPTATFIGIATFKYRVTDNDGEYSEALVTINVRAINHNPVANDDNVTVIKNTPKAINVLANDTGLEDGFGSMSIYRQPTNGTVTINANRTITYTPTTGFIGDDSFEYFIEDADGDKDIATVNVVVVERPNAIPVAVPDSRATEMNILVNVDVLFNDYGLEDGIASVTLASSPANGTAVVKEVEKNGKPYFTITYKPNTGYLGTETFKYQVCDLNGDCSNTALVTILVKPTGTNHNPVAVDDNATTFVNIPVAIDVLSNDSGLEDGFGKLEIHTQPEFGQVVVNANNTVTYTPSYMFTGTVTFEYVVSDIEGDYDVATVTVNVVEKTNSLPVANDVSVATSFNTNRIIDVLYNDTGLEDVPIVVTISEVPVAAQGTATVNGDNTVTFKPKTGFKGIATFKYKVTDANGDNATATVTVNVKAGINYIPNANDDAATTIINTPVEIDVLDNDTGLEDGFKSLSIYQNPAFGTAQVTANNTIRYTPSNFFKGEVTFRYLVKDMDGDFDWATVTVTVTEKTNSIPVANDLSVATGFNQARDIEVLINDSGLEDVPIIVTIRQQPNVEHGTVILNGDNTVKFTPKTGYIGVATFEYTVTDANLDSDWATVTVNVKAGENFIPKANDDAATTLVNTPIEIDVLNNDTGLEDGFASLSIYQNPTFGTAVITANRTIVYTPSNFYTGVVTFRYLVKDIDGDFDWATVTVTVQEKPNSIPVANDDRVGTSFNTPRIIDVLQNDTGLEDVPIVVSIRQNPAVAQGTVVVNGDKSVTFTPKTGYIGIATFEYTVTDANLDSDWATVTVTVKDGENFIPKANDDAATTQVNTPTEIHVLANDTGFEDGFASLEIFQSPKFGTAVVTTNRTIIYTPSNFFTGVVTFRYLVSDADGDSDWATVTVTVEEKTNSIPVVYDQSVGTSFNTPRVIEVLQGATGLDDVPITVSINYEPNPAQGSVVVNSDNTVTFTPALDFVGVSTFQFTATDVDDDADFATVTVNVKSGVNYIPVANDDNAFTYVNASRDIDVLANDTGLEDGFGSLEIYKQPKFGTAEVIAGNLIRFIPANNYMGVMTFTYKLSDVDGDNDIATVTVGVVDIINPKPVANDDWVGASYNTKTNIDVLANDTGIEDKPITVTILSAPDPLEGIAVVNGDNTVDFTPATDFTGLATFTYLVTDANGDEDNATVYVTVLSGQNSVPIAIDDFRGTSLNTPIDVEVLENDLNLNDNPITVTIKEHCNPAFGVAVVNSNNTVTFTPTNGYSGYATFTYTVTDAEGDNDSALVSITVKEGVNITPIAVDDIAFTHMEVPVEINVLTNDTDLDEDPITVYVNPANVFNGVVEVLGNNLVKFTPATGFIGETIFKYRVVDVDGDFDEAFVTVHVYSEVIAINDDVEVKRNESSIINVLANDLGIESIIPEVTIIYMPSHGSAWVNADNTVTYEPYLDYFGDDSFEYRVCSQYEFCSEAKVNIDVKIDRFRIPEGFSPDGDGKNDMFEIIGIEAFNQVKISVYNRWGNIVYQNNNYKNNWDGKASASMSVGRTLPTGTYYYIIEIVDTNKKYTGNVFLKR